MTPTLQVSSHQRELDRIVRDVLGTMFAASSSPSTRTPGPDSISASVGFVGDWSGALLVRSGVATAIKLAQLLLNVHYVSTEDVIDAMGELANMIGGNLKSFLPPGVALAVPNVALGNDMVTHICGANESYSTVYCCEAGDFEVTLVRIVGRPSRN